MSSRAYISEEILPPVLYVQPPFFSKRDIRYAAGAALVSAVALSAIALYVQPLVALIAGACVTALAGACLVKKGLTYYAKITQDSNHADQALTVHLDRLKSDSGKVVEGFRQLNRGIGDCMEGVDVKLAVTLSEMDETISTAETVTLVNCMDRLLEAMHMLSEQHGSIPQSLVSRISDGNHVPLGMKNIMYLLGNLKIVTLIYNAFKPLAS